MRVVLVVVAMLVAWSLVADAKPKRARKRVYVRGVVAHVAPRIETRNVVIDPSGIAAAAIGDGQIDDAGVTVQSAMRPTAIVGYVVPKTHERLSIETLIGVPVLLKIEATGRLANESLAADAFGTPTGIPALGSDFAEARIAPPMITALYRPLQVGRVSLLTGAGASVLLIYDERVTNAVLTEVTEPELEITHAFGLVLQSGIEARLWRRVVARIDLKYIAYRTSRATIDNITIRTQLPQFPTVDVGSAHMDISAHPVIVQAGVGADF